MITLHPTTKRVNDGFIPMITLRGDKGHMIGSRVPQGGYREFNTYTCEHTCSIEARLIALRVAAQYPEIITVAA